MKVTERMENINKIGSKNNDMLTACKSRLYPNKEQIETFSRCFGRSRVVWDKTIGPREDYCKKPAKSISSASWDGFFGYLKYKAKKQELYTLRKIKLSTEAWIL